MLGECQVNVKSQSELDIGGRETCQILVLAQGPLVLVFWVWGLGVWGLGLTTVNFLEMILIILIYQPT